MPCHSHPCWFTFNCFQREREALVCKKQIGCLSHAPTCGPGPQARNVPQLGTEPANPSIPRPPLTHSTSQAIYFFVDEKTKAHRIVIFPKVTHLEGKDKYVTGYLQLASKLGNNEQNLRPQFPFTSRALPKAPDLPCTAGVPQGRASVHYLAIQSD